VGDLDGPEHLNGFGDSDVVEVEVDEAGEAQDADGVPDLLDPWDELDQVVCDHALHAPVPVEVDKGGEDVVHEGPLHKECRRHDAHHSNGYCPLNLPVGRGVHQVTRPSLLLWCEGTSPGPKVVESTVTGICGGENPTGRFQTEGTGASLLLDFH